MILFSWTEHKDDSSVLCHKDPDSVPDILTEQKRHHLQNILLHIHQDGIFRQVSHYEHNPGKLAPT
jgi:hypothetical protein